MDLLMLLLLAVEKREWKKNENDSNWNAAFLYNLNHHQKTIFSLLYIQPPRHDALKYNLN